MLLPEDFASLMFMLELHEDKIKFDSISKRTIIVDHPIEKMMKDLSQMLTTGLNDSILKQMMNKDK